VAASESVMLDGAFDSDHIRHGQWRALRPVASIAFAKTPQRLQTPTSLASNAGGDLFSI
jgi:hypothetical protein